MTVDPVLDQICQFFGGAYVPAFHSYRTMIIPGINQVRRAFDKLTDFEDFFVPNLATGSPVGAQAVIRLTDGTDRRIALPAVTGRKHHTYQVGMYVYFWGASEYAEDTQDAQDTVRRAIIARLRTDPTCGSGGIEAGQFHVGVQDDRGQGGDINWHQSDAVTVDQVTRASLTVEFEAHEFPVG